MDKKISWTELQGPKATVFRAFCLNVAVKVKDPGLAGAATHKDHQ